MKRTLTFALLLAGCVDNIGGGGKILIPIDAEPRPPSVDGGTIDPDFGGFGGFGGGAAIDGAAGEDAALQPDQAPADLAETLDLGVVDRGLQPDQALQLDAGDASVPDQAPPDMDGAERSMGYWPPDNAPRCLVHAECTPDELCAKELMPPRSNVNICILDCTTLACPVGTSCCEPIFNVSLDILPSFCMPDEHEFSWMCENRLEP